MRTKLIKWLNKKIFIPYLKHRNAKIEKQWNNDKFLAELCTENNVLDLDKYDRLMSMVKRKYK